MAQDTEHPQGIDRVFPLTGWDTILQAKGDSDAGVVAFGRLCERYREGIKAYLVGQCCQWSPRATRAEIDDLLAEFISPIQLGRVIRSVQPQGGRFRAYLLTSIGNFLVSALRKRVLPPPEPPDEPTAEEPSLDPAPEKLLDLEIARKCHREALTAARLRFHAMGDRLEKLQPFLFFKPAPPLNYRTIGESLGMTEGAVKKAVHDLRQHYASLWLQEVATLVSSPADIEAESKHLLGVLANDPEILKME